MPPDLQKGYSATSLHVQALTLVLDVKRPSILLTLSSLKKGSPLISLIALNSKYGKSILIYEASW